MLQKLWCKSGLCARKEQFSVLKRTILKVVSHVTTWQCINVAAEVSGSEKRVETTFMLSLDTDHKLMYHLSLRGAGGAVVGPWLPLWECRGKLWGCRDNLGLAQVSELKHNLHFFLVCCLQCLHCDHPKPRQLSLTHQQTVHFVSKRCSTEGEVLCLTAEHLKLIKMLLLSQ